VHPSKLTNEASWARGVDIVDYVCSCDHEWWCHCLSPLSLFNSTLRRSVACGTLQYSSFWFLYMHTLHKLVFFLYIYS